MKNIDILALVLPLAVALAVAVGVQFVLPSYTGAVLVERPDFAAMGHTKFRILMRGFQWVEGQSSPHTSLQQPTGTNSLWLGHCSCAAHHSWGNTWTAHPQKRKTAAMSANSRSEEKKDIATTLDGCWIEQGRKETANR